MVSFRSLAAVGVALIAGPVMAAIELAEVRTTFETLNAQVESLQDTAGKLNLATAALYNVGAGSYVELFHGFSEPVSTIDNAYTKVLGSDRIPDSVEAHKAAYTFFKFTRKTELLTDILRDQVNLLQVAPKAGPAMVEGLREVTSWLLMSNPP